LKGDPLRLHYTSTLTDNNNVYGENVREKATGKNVAEKMSWMKSHRKKSHIYNVIFQIIKIFSKNYFNALIFNLFILYNRKQI
jgi:hypothetical protein